VAVDRCIIVNRSGVSYGEIVDFELNDLTWRAGPSHSASFSVGIADRNVGEIKTKTREVQFWRDGTCIWWGRLDKARRAGNRVQVGCVGLWDYFKYRYFGPPSTNKLLNPGFENNFSNWTNVGLTTTTIETSNTNRGLQSGRMSATPNSGDRYLTQTYTEVHTGPPGLEVPFNYAGWCFIQSFGDPAFQERGLYVLSSATGIPLYEERWVPITASTPKSKWIRLELDRPIHAPTGTTFNLESRLYCPLTGGDIIWDDIFLGPETYVGSAVVVDINTIVSNIIGYALAKDANALNMTYLGVTTGKTGTRLYPESGHGNIAKALEEFSNSDHCEYDITWPAAATTRNVQLYSPRKGSYKPEYILEDDNGGRIISADGWEEGTTQTISKPRFLGQGDGVDREYSEAQNTSLTDGVIFEAVRSAPQDVPLSGLDKLANAELLYAGGPVLTPTITCSADEMFDKVQWGDSMPVRISKWPTAAVTMRITSISLKGDNSLVLGLVTN